MKSILLAAAGLFMFQAQSDIIKCNYTEPFYSTTYSMTKSRLTITDSSGSKTYRNVSFQILGAGHFELWDKNRNVLQTLFLNFEGSDGMSDDIYPYKGITSPRLNNSGRDHFGGCTSNYQKKQ